jgi:single-stranded-DNA-specific exonuclease
MVYLRAMGISEWESRVTTHGERDVLGVGRSASDRAWVDRLDLAGAGLARRIAQETGLPDIVARLLASRGVEPEAAEGYLNPQIRALMPDPSRLTAMDAAAVRLADAIERRTRIAIVGDYDVDGASSAALLVRFLRHFGLEPSVFIPDRLVDGYGPNPRAIGELADAGAELVVALDCGTSSFEAFAEAKRRGLDVVAFDHHQAGVELPEMLALVNPNRQDDLSGFGYLAAVGVTFLGTVAVARELRQRRYFEKRGIAAPDLLALTDLVALGTVCDVVPLTGLNRALVVKGLTAMKARLNRGLAALADAARLSGPPTPYALGFLVGPRINAGGRIGDSTLGVRLLTTDDPVEAQRIASELDRLNRERQALEAAALEAAELMVVAELGSAEPSVIVAASPDWHPGIVGLVAARLKERYGCPAFAIALDGAGQGAGSGRSIAGVDLGKVVRAAVDEGLLVKGGGHAMAAGLTIGAERIADFRAFAEKAVADGVAASRAADALAVDGALTADGATLTLAETIERAGPFGSGQPAPLFVFPAHRLVHADVFGNGHLRLAIASAAGGRLGAVAFRAADRPLGEFLIRNRGASVHVAGHLEIDHWQGEARVQLRVVDAAAVRPERR